MFSRARIHLIPMKNRLNFAALVLALISASAITTPAHNLDTRATSISFDQQFVQLMSSRAGSNEQLVQVGDSFWVVIKTTPGPGTPTGVGGYQTFYVPPGMQIMDVAYVQPTTSNSLGFAVVPMKGQSPIAIGDGSIGAKTATGLTGYTYPVANILGINEAPVTAGGVARGTISGVYADTGIFFSSDPRTAFNSYNAPTNSPMINNSGDTVGEYDAANILGSDILGVMTLWDSYQLRAFGRKDVTAIIDNVDQRGNAPWGMASAVAGPESGYRWSFNGTYYDENPTDSDRIRHSIETGPWQRIKYPGSQISKDQAGLISTVIGYTGVDASNYGIAPSSVPSDAKAIRFAIGQLEIGRSEYSAVKVLVTSLPVANCSPIYGDAFGGDAGGTSNGKDHIWRYFDPTVVSLDPCALLQKVTSDPHIAPGGSTSFKITFANNGTLALPNVVLKDTLPAGLAYVSAVAAPSTVSGSTLYWNVGTVAPKQIVNITLYVKATATGALLNKVEAFSNGVLQSTAYDTVDVGTYSLLREEKTVTPENSNPGGTVTYTITVFNDGPGPNGTPLVVTDVLPAGFSYTSFVSATVNGAAVTPTINASNTNQPAFSLGQAIQPDKTAVIKFVATVGPNVTPGTYYNGVDLAFEGKKIGPHPEAPVIVGTASSIGDTVYTDSNGNGSQDIGEPGISGVTVTLYQDNGSSPGIWDAGDAQVTTKVTDANGYYLFTGLAAGNYVVRILSPPAGTNTGNPLGGAGNPTNQGAATVTGSNSVLTVDFGYGSATLGSIGDLVYYDVNSSGTYDGGDLPLANVTVRRYASDGTTLQATTSSDANGIYSFSGVASDTYQVKVDFSDEDIPANLTSTQPAGTYSSVVLTPGQNRTDIDFPFTDPGYLTKTVDKATATAGELLTFTLSPYHPGPTLLTNATVTDSVPTGTAFGSFIQTGGAVSNVPPLTWTLGSNSDASAAGSFTGSSGGVPIVYSGSYPGNGLSSQTITGLPFQPAFVIIKADATTGTAVARSSTMTLTKDLGQGDVAAVANLITALNADGFTLGSSNARVNASSTTYHYVAFKEVAGEIKTGTYTGNNNPVTVTVGFQPAFVLTMCSGAKKSGFRTADNTGTDSFELIASKVKTNQITSLTATGFVVDGGPVNENGLSYNYVAFKAVTGQMSTGTFVGNGTSGSVTTAGFQPAFVWVRGDSADNIEPVFKGSSTGNGTDKSESTLGLANFASGITSLTANGFTYGSLDKVNQSTKTTYWAAFNSAQPGVTSPSTTSSLAVNRRLVTDPNIASSTIGDGVNVDVTLTLTSTITTTAVTPPTLTVAKTLGSLGGAQVVTTPAPAVITAGTPKDFVYTFQLDADADVTKWKENLTFSFAQFTSGGATFMPTTSPSVIVTQPLKFTATVNSTPNVFVVNNAGKLNNNGSLIYTTPLTTTTLLGSIGNYVWWDDNRNGLQDEAADRKIVGAAVLLYVDANNNGILDVANGDYSYAGTTTNSSGLYLFSNLPAGNYLVDVYEDSIAVTGAEPVPTTPNVIAKTVGGVNPLNYTDADFGYYQGAIVEGVVFWDMNRDTVTETGETRLTPVKVFLDGNNNGILDWTDGGALNGVWDSGEGEQWMNTDAAGQFKFLVPEGDYTVTYVLTDVTALNSSLTDHTTDRSYSFHASPGEDGASFFYFGVDNSGTIGDTIFADINTPRGSGQGPSPGDAGLAGVTVNLYLDRNGDGIFDADGIDNILGNADDELLLDTQVTAANGTYWFVGLADTTGSEKYLVQVDTASLPAGYTISSASSYPAGANASASSYATTLTLAGGRSINTVDFGYQPVGTTYTVSGNIWNDANGNGTKDGEANIANVTVTISVNGVIYTVTTDATGNYSLGGVPGSAAIIITVNTATLPSSAFVNTYDPDNPGDPATNSTTSFTMPASANAPAKNFGYQEQLGSIAGTVVTGLNGNGVKDGLEAGLPGATVTLYYAGPDGIFNSADDVGPDGIFGTSDDIGRQTSVTTGDPGAGTYSFTGLVPGNYQIMETNPPGYSSWADADGGNPDNIIVTLDLNEDKSAQDFEDTLPGAISGTVQVDTNSSYTFTASPPDALLGGVTLWLLDDSGDPVLDHLGDPIWTTSAALTGAYSFAGLLPGNYQVAETQPPNYGSISDRDTTLAEYQAGKDPNLIGDDELITVTAGGTNSGNDFLEIYHACPDNWDDWVAKWSPKVGAGNTGPTLNPDGDRYNNLDEYAFCMPPNSGALKPFCLVPGLTDSGKIDGVFRRTAGGTTDVTYTLEHSASLTPTNWSLAPLTIIFPSDPLANVTVSNNGDGTETVRITDLEAKTGLNLGEGFVRMRVDLDEDGNDVIDATSYTEVLGWTETVLGTSVPDVVYCRTYNNPYLRCSSFTGTVDAIGGVDGLTLDFTTSAGPAPWDLSSLLPPVVDLLPVSYYVEVTSGGSAGQRFEVASATANTLTVAPDDDLCEGIPPFNTLIVPALSGPALPANLAGATVIIRRHWTLREMFPVTGFVANADPAQADQVQTYTPGAVPSPWTTYFLYTPDSGTTRRWVALGNTSVDKGSTVIPPGQGMFVNKRGSEISLLAYGEVRENNFIRPLCAGHNLVGGGYPIDQSATGAGSRQMNLSAVPLTSFLGTRDFKTADAFFLWQGDASPGANAYDSYFLLNAAPPDPAWVKWVKVGDAGLSPWDAAKLFLGERSAFIRVKYDLHTYTIPSPWTP